MCCLPRGQNAFSQADGVDIPGWWVGSGPAQQYFRDRRTGPAPAARAASSTGATSTHRAVCCCSSGIPQAEARSSPGASFGGVTSISANSRFPGRRPSMPFLFAHFGQRIDAGSRLGVGPCHQLFMAHDHGVQHGEILHRRTDPGVA